MRLADAGQGGVRVHPGTYLVNGLVLMACSDFGQALAQTQRYEQLAHELGRTSLSVEDMDALYTWTSHYPGASRHLGESGFAGIRALGSWLAGQAPAGLSCKGYN